MTFAQGTIWCHVPALSLFLAGFMLVNLAIHYTGVYGWHSFPSRARPAGAPRGRLAQSKEFSAAASQQAASGRPGSIVKVDIDGFRTVQAQHGDEIAQTLLSHFSQALCALPGPIAITQIQGDLFGLLLRDITVQELDAMCSAIASAISGAYWCGDVRLDVSVCIGAAELRAPGSSEAAMSAAFIALERAKSRGPGSRQIYDDAIAESVRLESRLAVELRAGISRNEVVPYYQPIVDLKTGEICGFEVLARWSHPQFGLLLPASFIHLAERQYLSAALSLSLLRQVSEDQASWPDRLYFAFNAPPSQLREVVEFALLPRRPASTLLDPTRLELEITENALIEDLEMARTVTKTMHAVGARVAIDDFGTGYANFTHLREIPFDCIKIDKSFVLTLGSDPRSAACVQAIMALANSLNTPATAEGVENAETAKLLAELGCARAQGYFFGRPVPASGVPAMLSQPQPAAADIAPAGAAAACQVAPASALEHGAEAPHALS